MTISVDPDRIERSNVYQPHRFVTQDDCFLELPYSSQYLVDWFNSQFNNLDFSQEVHYWNGCECPVDVWKTIPLLAKVHEQFPISRAGFLKLQPHRCFDWHLDGNRGVAINSIMTPDVKGVCLFGNQLDIATLETTELVYKPATFYLFNTQVPHQVLTWDEDRYMFSVEFEQNKYHLKYRQLREWLTSNPI